MVKATVGGVAVEIWFTPSFNIKTTSKDLEQQLRNLSLDVFDPWETRTRTVKATKGEREAYMVLEELSRIIPELKIKITEHPEHPRNPDNIKELLN